MMKKKTLLLDKIELPPELTTMRALEEWYLKWVLELTRVPEELWEGTPKRFYKLPPKDEEE